MSESTVRARADCPRPWGGSSAVQNFEPTDLQTSLTKTRSDRRTVRSPGADCPSSKGEHTQKPQCFCPRIFSRRRTVRPQGPDRPQYNLDTQDRTTKFLCPFQLLKADHPPPWAGRSVGHFGLPTEPKTALLELNRDNGGPSAPQGRTVRRSISSRNVPR